MFHLLSKGGIFITHALTKSYVAPHSNKEESMKRYLLLALLAVLTCFLVVPSVAVAQAQAKIAVPVNVTFVINTSTVPDTVVASSSVTIIGDNAAITAWGTIPPGSTGIAATNIGGDYWSKTITFNSGDSVRYKFRVGGAWESNSDDIDNLTSDNRSLIVGTKDTTLPVQFPNFTSGTLLQYRRPWASVGTDTTVVYFRVNMQGLSSKPFSKTADTVAVRGDKKSGTSLAPDFGWAPSRYLTKETANANFAYDGSNFWSGAIKLPKSKFAGGDSVGYKFLIGYDWGRDEGVDRLLVLPKTKGDTTLYYVWYNNEKPITRLNSDTVTVTFNADMTTAVQRSFFNVTGDTLQVQFGFFATADSQYTLNLVRQGLTNRYQGTKKVMSKIGSPLDYQYYWVKNGATIREYYYNFQYSGTLGAEQERRQATPTSKTFTVVDSIVSVTAGRRQPEFENQRKITKDVTVTWRVDLRPAYYTIKRSVKTLTDIQGTYTITPALIDSIRVWGLWMNGPAVGGWGNTGGTDWGSGLTSNLNKKLYDNGTNGDAVANDSIYTRTVTYKKDTATVGQVFKFGIRGGDNESAFGLNHLANIDDTNPTFSINAQFGSINPSFYDAWDFNRGLPSYVEQLSSVPGAFNLKQNYPNPFNPSTRIEFSLPRESNVILTVYNLLGQEVATLVNESLRAGTHAVTFDAAKFSTGLYFYRLEATGFESVKKMMLLK